MILIKESNIITNNNIQVNNSDLERLYLDLKKFESEFGKVESVYHYKIPQLHKGFYIREQNYAKMLYYNKLYACYVLIKSIKENKYSNFGLELKLLVKSLKTNIALLNKLVSSLDNNALINILEDISPELYYFSLNILENLVFIPIEEIPCDTNVSDELDSKIKIAKENKDVLTLSKKIKDKLSI